MSEVTQEHRALAVELVSKFGCWGRDMSGQPDALGHIDIDLAAQAIADAEQRAYARGLADGAERERAPVETLLANLQDDTFLSLSYERGEAKPVSLAVIDGSACGEGATLAEAARSLCAELDEGESE